MNLCIFLALFLFATGCGREKAPDFDARRGHALLDTAEAIADNRDSDALDAIAQLRSLSTENAPFAAEAALAVRRRQYMDTVINYLEVADYQALRLFLASKEATGEAGAQLLQIDALPDALEALALFRARMPWEDSESLSTALTRLKPHLPLLETSPAFRTFHAGQIALLWQLRAREAAAAASVCMEHLGRATLAGDASAAMEQTERLRRLAPDHPFFRYVKLLKGNSTFEVREGETQAAGIALLCAWPGLRAPRRRAAAAALRDTGICGLLVNTLLSGSLKDYEKYFTAAMKGRYPVRPELAAGYVELLSPPPSQYAAWCWRTPCPGPTDFLYRIQQLKTSTPLNKKLGK